jgi:dienelactone hydrolase
MKIPLFGLCLGLLGLAGAGPGGRAAEASPPANPASQAMIQSFLTSTAQRMEAGFLEGITNRAQWEAGRGKRYQEYLEMLGLWPLPERTSLQAKVTGVRVRDEGFRVENVHFQSRPGLYVTGNLYLPKDAKPGTKLPAVLYVCGHSGRGRDGNKTAFQHHGMWFATHGYACLVIDTLQLGEIAAIHHGTYRHDRWWWQARGYTSAAVECWNGVRALDYLQSRPEVDPERLAVTGISGGGMATFWIAAADERVKVAVPVSGLSDLEDYIGDKVVNGHCDCMFTINTFQWPWTQLGALVAPRPLLFANSGHDTIFPMNGNDRIRARLERLYSFYTNRTERVFDIGVVPGGHEDKPELRLLAYRWINKHLKGDDSPVTEPVLPPFEGKLLRAFPDELPKDELNTRIDEFFVPAATNNPPRSTGELATWRAGKLAEPGQAPTAGQGSRRRQVARRARDRDPVEIHSRRGNGRGPARLAGGFGRGRAGGREAGMGWTRARAGAGAPRHAPGQRLVALARSGAVLHPPRLAAAGPDGG